MLDTRPQPQKGRHMITEVPTHMKVGSSRVCKAEESSQEPCQSSIFTTDVFVQVQDPPITKWIHATIVAMQNEVLSRLIVGNHCMLI